MPTPAELDRVRAALNRLSASARVQVRQVFADTRDRDAQIRALLAILERHGEVSALLGADMFEAWAVELGVRPRTDMVAASNPERAAARFDYALNKGQGLGMLDQIMDELIKQPYRSTMQGSALKSKVGWARVPTGGETCVWCYMLASRGGVYHSKQLAQFGTNGKSYHGDCDCTPVPVRDPSDYPEGYDPDALYERYQIARDNADSHTASGIASSWRSIEGGH